MSNFCQKDSRCALQERHANHQDGLSDTCLNVRIMQLKTLQASQAGQHLYL